MTFSFLKEFYVLFRVPRVLIAHIATVSLGSQVLEETEIK